VLPFLRAAKYQTSAQTDDPRFQLLAKHDVETMISADILPIWFDREQAQAAFNELAHSFVPTSTTQEIGPIVYLASLAIAVERFELARELLGLVESRGHSWHDWSVVLQSQLSISLGDCASAAQLIQAESSNLTGATGTLGSYLAAAPFYGCDEAGPTADSSLPFESDELLQARAALLDLLKIPALESEQHPALAAAALYQSGKISRRLGWNQEGEILWRELQSKFPESYHARLLERRDR
jgi:hypothetical protein